MIAVSLKGVLMTAKPASTTSGSSSGPSRCRVARERGTISPLILGFVGIVVLLIVAVSNVSRVFVYDRDIESAADAAALAAANGISVESVYRGGLGNDVELSRAAAEQEVREYLDATGVADRLNLEGSSVVVSGDGTDVTVTFRGRVHLPLTGLLPGLFDGGVPVTGEATATIYATQ